MKLTSEQTRMLKSLIAGPEPARRHRGGGMTPREHIAEALDRTTLAHAYSRVGAPHLAARAQGAAAGHAFRALELGYDERERLIQIRRKQREFWMADLDRYIEARDSLELALAMGRAACERIAELEAEQRSADVTIAQLVERVFGLRALLAEGRLR